MPPTKIFNSHEYTKFFSQINDKLSFLFNRRRREKLLITNPFIYVWNIAWYQWLKMALLSVTLFPVRLFFLVIFFSLSFVISYITTVSQEENVPMTGWRKKVMMPLFIVSARLTFFFGGLQWITVKGRHSPRDYVPLLVVAPHSTFMDALIVVCLGMNTVLGKQETARSTIGCFLKMTQPVIVNREDPDSRLKTLYEIERRCRKSQDWQQIIIFPEGTCTNRTCIIDFKTGAFRSGLPVQPVILRWPNKVDTVTWTWEGPGAFTLLWMTMTQFQTALEIEFLPAYYPSEEEKNNPKQFANNVREIMAKQLGVRTTDYSYEDCRHMTMAKQVGLPFSEIIVEINSITKHFTNQFEGEQNFIQRLQEINQDMVAGKITVKELSSRLQVQSCSTCHKLDSIFKFYDKNKTGSIQLHELLADLAFFSLPFNRRLALRHAVQAYKDSMMLDESTAGNEVLCHVFVLSPEEVSEILSLIQANSPNNAIVIDSIEDTMAMLGGPFNMYVDYFTSYNRSKRLSPQQDLTSPETEIV